MTRQRAHDVERTNSAKPRLPGWEGEWTLREPWRFSIDLVHSVSRSLDGFANWYEKWLRTTFDIEKR